MKAFGTLIHEWLTLPDQYDRFTRYLRDNGLSTASRVLFSVLLVGLGVYTVLTRYSLNGPSSPTALFFNAVAALACFVGGICWWIFGTTRNRSYCLVVGCDLVAAVVILGDPDAISRLLTAVIFALVGIYIAYFHNPRMQIAHLVFAGSMIAVAAQPIMFGPGADPATSASKFILVIAALIICALISQIVTMLSMDASSSDLDPLTGLLNRRGLDRQVEILLQKFRSADRVALLVVAVDIDRFKTINDVYGHDVGDRIILRVAQHLSSWAPSEAVVGRVGGDEFILVHRLSIPSIGPLLDSIGPAMQTDSEQIPSTTSIGVAVRTTGFAPNERLDVAFAEVLKVADSAMYECKRLGGGRVHTIVTTQQRDQ
ncbi:diguanylate cyclase (GGDEF)-like protein [Rhodococcus sp. 27YEA15]|uniref:GGDEF domain-containing protein n=1 Tax=Rhodococcus sp. 27YEA15 TaxID=3156259 RepID=UPI003C7DF952